MSKSVGACVVYNIEVEDFHTYFVGPFGVWVHNKSPLKFDRLNPNLVPDPKPQWTPLHDSEVGCWFNEKPRWSSAKLS